MLKLEIYKPTVLIVCPMIGFIFQRELEKVTPKIKTKMVVFYCIYCCPKNRKILDLESAHIKFIHEDLKNPFSLTFKNLISSRMTACLIALI